MISKQIEKESPLLKNMTIKILESEQILLTLLARIIVDLILEEER